MITNSAYFSKVCNHTDFKEPLLVIIKYLKIACAQHDRTVFEKGM